MKFHFPLLPRDCIAWEKSNQHATRYKRAAAGVRSCGSKVNQHNKISYKHLKRKYALRHSAYGKKCNAYFGVGTNLKKQTIMETTEPKKEITNEILLEKSVEFTNIILDNISLVKRKNSEIWEHLEPTYINVRNLYDLVIKLDKKIDKLTDEINELKRN